MSREPYRVARLEDLTREDGWAPIRRALGVRSFGVNAWTADAAGATLIRQHDEAPSGHEELYLVTAGHADFTVDGTRLDAPVGTLVLVRDPAARREATAREAGTTVVVLGARPGAAYRPRAWETNAEVFGLLDRGDHEQARQLLLAALDVYEDRSTLRYNLACAEAQLGERDAALEHLSQAVRERAALAGDAARDDDLAPIRDDPRFAAIVRGH